MTKIFIDPGHGGSDPGAVGNGLIEKNITLQIARRINAILMNEYTGVTTRMSRTGDQTVSLSQRTNMANAWGANYFLSIHINSGGGTGYEDYIYNGSVSAATRSYQTRMHTEIMKQVDFRDRGSKRANFHVLRESRMPAILTENGFIDNRTDANKLANSAYIERIARGHVNGLASIFGLRKKVTRPTPASPPQTTTNLYRVQAGAFSSRENAKRLADQLKRQGIPAYVSYSNNLYKVQAGAFTSRENAERQVNELKKKGFNAFITN